MPITRMAARRCVQLALPGASALVSSAVMAAPALAQNATGIEEVVVTARKVAVGWRSGAATSPTTAARPRLPPCWSARAITSAAPFASPGPTG